MPNTIRSVRNHQYEDWVGKLKSDRDVKEREKPKDTDGADVVRYLCLNRPIFDRLGRWKTNRDSLTASVY